MALGKLKKIIKICFFSSSTRWRQKVIKYLGRNKVLWTIDRLLDWRGSFVRNIEEGEKCPGPKKEGMPFCSYTSTTYSCNRSGVIRNDWGFPRSSRCLLIPSGHRSGDRDFDNKDDRCLEAGDNQTFEKIKKIVSF